MKVQASIRAKRRPAIVGCVERRVQMANAAVRCKASYFATVYHRLAPRCGHKRALIAVAHRLLIAVYHILRQHQPYRDYRTTDPGQRSQDQRLKKLQQQVELLSYQVQLVPLAVPQPPTLSSIFNVGLLFRWLYPY